MKRIMVLVIALFLVTGCSVKYNLTINEDLTVNEEAKLTGTDSFFATYYKTTKLKVVKDFVERYKEDLDENNYQYEVKEDKTPYVIVSKKYNDVNEYINNSKLFNDYFDEIKYTEDGNIKKIETIGFRENESQNPDRFDISELEIAITCPYNVKNHNAEEVDKETNTYYFKLDEDHTKILFEYDTSGKFNPKAELLKTLMLCLIFVVGLWLVIIVLTKKNNKNYI